MFESTRIKLTAWYLLIIMSVSVAFSAVIYTGITFELDRFARIQRYQFERHVFNGNQIYSDIIVPSPVKIDPELIFETRRRILFILAFINLTILVISGGLGYLLSGKTLAPIETMLNDQRRFISDASHELRTPIAALKTSLEVNLRDEQLTIDEAKTEMNQQLTKVNQLQKLTDQMITLIRQQRQQNITPPKMVNLANVLNHSIQAVAPLAKAKQITISSVPTSITFFGNDESMIQLFTILLDNAIKYSFPNSEVTIKISKSNQKVTIKIIDHGIGIAKNDLPHIFDRFYRADQARHQSGTNGYGLGLAIAQDIVSRYQGTLTVISKINSGSTFTVTLPISENYRHNNT